ncbi:unnamed protein product, partial [Effrenium voratum]
LAPSRPSDINPDRRRKTRPPCQATADKAWEWPNPAWSELLARAGFCVGVVGIDPRKVAFEDFERATQEIRAIWRHLGPSIWVLRISRPDGLRMALACELDFRRSSKP